MWKKNDDNHEVTNGNIITFLLHFFSQYLSIFLFFVSILSISKYIDKYRYFPSLVFAHRTYSADLASCGFWVFGILKRELCNRHFQSDVEFVTAVNRFFQNLPTKEFLKTMSAKWKERMLASIVNDVYYFEKDIVDHDEEDDE